MAKSGTVNFYNGVATQSLRFEHSDSAYLTRTPDSASNRKTWTWSAWVKRGDLVLSGQPVMFGAGTSGNAFSMFYFNKVTSTLLFYDYDGSTDYGWETEPLLRDPSAWYHIMSVYDSTNSTATDRLKIYVNGVQHTGRENDYGNFPLNYETHINATSPHNIGKYPGNTQYFDGYLSEANFIDGLALTPTSFGETKNGVWIPIDTSGLTFGTNGFRLKFDQVGVGTASSSTIGADTSGNTNHFTSSGIVASDCAMPDSPENNFCTGNSIGNVYAGSVGNNPTYSEGNLEFETAGNPTHGYGTMSVNHFLTDGCYFEVRADSTDDSRTYIGIVDPQSSANEASYGFVGKALFQGPAGRLHSTTATNGASVLPDPALAYNDGDIIGVAVKGTSIWFHLNGTYTRDGSNNVGNPSTGANPAITSITDIANQHYLPYAGYNSDFTFNFGQDSSFAAAETAQGNADANGIGDFYYAPPTGFLAICSANMEEPTIGPNSTSQADDHFDTAVYSGDNSVLSINDLAFQPDWVWIKQRNGTGQNMVQDSSRGPTAYFYTDAESPENTDTDRDWFRSFDDDGFTVSRSTTGGETTSEWNTSGNTYVAWNWKANGGTATATISESGDNPAAVVQANPTAGFSLITYTGTGDSGTIAHGLSAVPTMMIIKNRDVGDPWAVYHGANTAAPATDYLILDTSAATADSATMWADTAPTDSVFTVHDSHQVNADGEKYVAYVFADIEGYSKMGSYTANNSADGPFVYLGFRPAWVMFKDTTNTSAWIIKDSVRGTVNPNLPHLAVHTSAAEGSTADCDFLSNGFKIRQADAAISFANKAAATMIYMAFAEAPFKYANAR